MSDRYFIIDECAWLEFPLMTVGDWLNYRKISDNNALDYPNAATAKAVKESPLYKALA